MSYRVRFVHKVVYIIMFLWSIVIFSALFISIHDNYSYAQALAKNEAIVSVKKDLAYRSWVASHGGVYVPITKKTPPNQYLTHIQNRDVNTSANQQLTLMNPAYTLSQMMNDYAELYGTKGHITSRILMNPKNKPDKWEEKVLEDVEITGKSEFTKAIIDGEEYYRYLKPLVTKESCLKCHAFQGYKVGDIRGGVSVSIPMKKYNEEAFSNSKNSMVIFTIIYLIGLVVILYGRKKAKEIIENKIKNYEQHIYSLVNIIEKRDSYTAGHTQRVARYSVLIAKEMDFNEEEVDDMYRACMLHDIGKISTPDSVLLKPGKLTDLEYEIIKEHVVVSYELLSGVDIYKKIAEIVRHHHEHYDGSGYPKALKGDEIPILSHVMTVADSFDAMTTNRIYKSKKNVVDALEELSELAGKQFHPEVVKAAIIALKDIEIEVTITQRPKSKIEKERFSYYYRDLVTGVYNMNYLEFVLTNNHAEEFNVRCINAFYLHDFNQYNRRNSWQDGNELLKEFAKKLDSISANDFVFRIHGDDFIVLNIEHFDIEDYKKDLEKVLDGTGITIEYKHFDIKEEEIKNIKDLEKML